MNWTGHYYIQEYFFSELIEMFINLNIRAVIHHIQEVFYVYLNKFESAAIRSFISLYILYKLIYIG